MAAKKCQRVSCRARSNSWDIAPLAAWVIVGFIGLEPVHDGVVEAQESDVQLCDNEVLVVACVCDECELSKIRFVAKVLGKVLFLYYTFANKRNRYAADPAGRLPRAEWERRVWEDFWDQEGDRGFSQLSLP